MTRHLLIALCLVFALLPQVSGGNAQAQETAPAPAQQAGKAAAEQEKPAAEKQADQPPPAAPAGQENFSATIDFGYRWVPRLNGNENVYRTLVNFGEGPKLFGANLRLRAPQPTFYDRIDVQLSHWGGDPYSTGRLDMVREGAYSLTFNYRKQDYFNIIPSFANPLLALGSPLSQTGRDIQRRMFDVQLDVFPQQKFSPFFSYQRNSEDGPGYNALIGPGNEYLLNTLVDDQQDVFRAGAHINFKKLHVTVEAGGTRFSNDQRLFLDAGPNPGNRRTPLLGINMFLNGADQRYKITGDSLFARATINVQPAPFLDLFGTFSFTQPSIDFTLAESATGQFVRGQAPLFSATNWTTASAGDATRGQPSANVSMEVRPTAWLRIVDSFYTDRFHISSGRLFNQTFTGVTGLLGTVIGPTFTASDTLFRLFTFDYNRHQVEAIAEVHPRVTLRGGHRYEWSDARVPSSPLSAGGTGRGPTFERAEQQRHIALAGVQVKVATGFTFNGDAEVSSGDQVYFRTGLLDYQRVRLRWRYRPTDNLTFNGGYKIFRNQNDRPDTDYKFISQEGSVGFFFAPGGGRRLTFNADYSYLKLDSDIFILLPPFLEPGRSNEIMQAHSASLFAGLTLPRGGKLSLGGSLVINNGTRPTDFYQPRAELFVPVNRRVSWFGEWRWYGFTEEQYRFENFTSHQFSTGLRLTL